MLRLLRLLFPWLLGPNNGAKVDNRVHHSPQHRFLSKVICFGLDWETELPVTTCVQFMACHAIDVLQPLYLLGKFWEAWALCHARLFTLERGPSIYLLLLLLFCCRARQRDTYV